MMLGETILLVTALLLLFGATKGITARLRINDYVATFLILVILLLDLRGTIKVDEHFSLCLGGIFSLVVGAGVLLSNPDKAKTVVNAITSPIGCAAIVFTYSLHFLEEVKLDPRLLATLLSLLVGLWCALTCGKEYSTCLFSALLGGFSGSTIYLIFFQMGGKIGGSYTFTVMWMGAIFGLCIRRLLDLLLRTTKSPRYGYYEAGRAEGESVKKKEK